MFVRSTILSSQFPLLDDELNGVGVVADITCRMAVGSVCVAVALEV